MPITLQDIKQRFEDLFKIFEEKGTELIKTEDGKVLKELLEELKEENERLDKENRELKKENEELKKNIITKDELERRFGKDNFDENGIYKGGSASSQKGEDEKEKK
jgi:FtsZ-binding cell division protein ZapB